MCSILSDYSPLSYDAGLRRAAHTNLTYNFVNRFTDNTFYYEGSVGRCGETAPGEATAIQDMMLLSVLGRISVFAGLDDENMTEACFHLVKKTGASLAFFQLIFFVPPSLPLLSSCAPTVRCWSPAAASAA